MEALTTFYGSSSEAAAVTITKCMRLFLRMKCFNFFPLIHKTNALAKNEKFFLLSPPLHFYLLREKASKLPNMFFNIWI